MNRSSRQKFNKETQALNDTTDQTDLIDIYRTFHPKAAEYTFFSSAYRIFSRIDHILGHKSSLSQFKKTEIISSIFSDHKAMRLEINYRDFPGDAVVKNPPANAGVMGLIPDPGRSHLPQSN